MVEIQRIGIAFFFTFFLLLSLHLYPLVKYSLPLGWDSGFYTYSITKTIEPLKNNVEPFYFYLSKSLSNIFGVFPTIKLIQFLSLVLLCLGTYLLGSENFSHKSGLVVMFLVVMIQGTSRVWLDQHRNMLALSLFPLLLLTLLKKEKKYVFLSGFILGLIGLTHRFVFIFTCFVLGLYLLVKLAMGKKERVKELIIVFTVAGILASPYLLYILIPSAKGEVTALFKWEMPMMSFGFVITMTSLLGVFFGISSFVLFINKINERKPITDAELLLFLSFCSSFLLFLGVFGTPFLVYERYMLLLSIMATLFSLPYLKELFSFIEEKYAKHSKHIILSIILLTFGIVGVSGFEYIKKMTPFITESELLAFQWMNWSIPHNDSLVVIPSREHYWFLATTDLKIAVAEWYELLGTKKPNDETLVIKGDMEETSKAISDLKARHNVTNVYVFFTFGADPITFENIEQQKSFMYKVSNWIKVNSWGNSYLFKVVEVSE